MPKKQKTTKLPHCPASCRRQFERGGSYWPVVGGSGKVSNGIGREQKQHGEHAKQVSWERAKGRRGRRARGGDWRGL